MFTALLDTCVLWPSLQRDLLLSLAAEGLYRPIWSSALLEELEYHEAIKLERRHGVPPAAAAERAQNLIAQMRAAFDDAEVEGWDGLAGTYGLPDADDEHVVAAAVVGGAGAIITDNVRDFPAHRFPAGLEVLTPAAFAESTVALDPLRAVTAVTAIARRSGRKGPSRTVEEILGALVERYHMDAAVALIRAT